MTAMIHRRSTRNGASVAGPAPADTPGTVAASWQPPLWATRTRTYGTEFSITYSTEPKTVHVGTLGEFRFTLEQDDSIVPMGSRIVVRRGKPSVTVEWEPAEGWQRLTAEDVLMDMSAEVAAGYAEALRDLVAIIQEFSGGR
jgi:hypothetical protein